MWPVAWTPTVWTRRSRWPGRHSRNRLALLCQTSARSSPIVRLQPRLVGLGIAVGVVAVPVRAVGLGHPGDVEVVGVDPQRRDDVEAAVPALAVRAAHPQRPHALGAVVQAAGGVSELVDERVLKLRGEGELVTVGAPDPAAREQVRWLL